MSDKRLSGAFGMLSDELNKPDADTRTPATTNKQLSKKPKAKPVESAGARLTQIDPLKVRSWLYKDREKEDLNGIDFEDLMRSIANEGQHTPIRVREIEHPDYNYEEIFGFRRLHACLALGIKVLALIEPINDEKGFVAQITENDDRTAPSFWRRANTFKMAIDNSLFASVEAMSIKTGIARSTIANYIRVAQYMPEIFRDKVRLQNCRRDTLFYFMALQAHPEQTIKDWIESPKTIWMHTNPIQKKEVEKSFKQFVKRLPDNETQKPVIKNGAKTYIGKAGKLFSITRKGDQVFINVLKDGKRIMTDSEIADVLQKAMDEKG
jgi:ParB/RepB/Spo0J family partition protein